MTASRFFATSRVLKGSSGGQRRQCAQCVYVNEGNWARLAVASWVATSVATVVLPTPTVPLSHNARWIARVHLDAPANAAFDFTRLADHRTPLVPDVRGILLVVPFGALNRHETLSLVEASGSLVRLKSPQPQSLRPDAPSPGSPVPYRFRGPYDADPRRAGRSSCHGEPTWRRPCHQRRSTHTSLVGRTIVAYQERTSSSVWIGVGICRALTRSSTAGQNRRDVRSFLDA